MTTPEMNAKLRAQAVNTGSVMGAMASTPSPLSAQLGVGHEPNKPISEAGRYAMEIDDLLYQIADAAAALEKDLAVVLADQPAGCGVASAPATVESGPSSKIGYTLESFARRLREHKKFLDEIRCRVRV